MHTRGSPFVSLYERLVNRNVDLLADKRPGTDIAMAGSTSLVGMGICSNGHVLVSTDVNGLLIATDVVSKTLIWSTQMSKFSLGAVCVFDHVVFVPVSSYAVFVLDLMTGKELRRYSILAGTVRNIFVWAGTLLL